MRIEVVLGLWFGVGWMLENSGIEVKGRINKVPAEGLAPFGRYLKRRY